MASRDVCGFWERTETCSVRAYGLTWRRNISRASSGVPHPWKCHSEVGACCDADAGRHGPNTSICGRYGKLCPSQNSKNRGIWGRGQNAILEIQKGGVGGSLGHHRIRRERTKLERCLGANWVRCRLSANGVNSETHITGDAADANSTRAQRKSRLHLPRLALLDRPPAKLLAVRTGARKSGHHRSRIMARSV